LTGRQNSVSIFKLFHVPGGKETLIKLAGIQITCSEEKERNIEKAVRFTKIAIEKGAQIICFQELFTTHWFPREMNKRFFSLAEKADGLTIATKKPMVLPSR